MNVFSVNIVDIHQFLNVRLLLCKGEVENAEVILVSLHASICTSLETTALLSNIRPSWERQSDWLTIVAEYPATAPQRTRSLIIVVLFIFKIMLVAGTRIPKKVAYVHRVMVLENLSFLS